VITRVERFVVNLRKDTKTLYSSMIVDFPLDVSCYIEVFNPHVGLNRYIIPAKIAGINIIVIPLPPSTLCFVKTLYTILL